MILVQNLTKLYGNLLAVNNLNFKVEKGEIFGLLGPNGAGKTTTLKILTGLLMPTYGRAIVAGYDVGIAPLKVKARIGYLPETIFLHEKLTGKEFLKMVGILRNIREEEIENRIQQLAEFLGLTDSLYNYIGSYSKGVRQKIAFANAILHFPEVLILDEPMTSLDPHYRKLIKDWILDYKSKGKTILISSHDTEMIESVCDRILIIEKGQAVIYGAISGIIETTKTKNLEDAFISLVRKPTE